MRGVQTHFTADHAIERARERRTLKGVVHSAPNAGPVRITRGEVEGLPGTLKRIVCCMSIVDVALNKETADTVATSTIVHSEEHFNEIGVSRVWLVCPDIKKAR